MSLNFLEHICNIEDRRVPFGLRRRHEQACCGKSYDKDVEVPGAPQSEPVGETKEIHLVDRVQRFHRRPLDDLVLDCRDTEWLLPAVGLRNVLPPRRLRPIATAHQVAVQVSILPPSVPAYFFNLPHLSFAAIHQPPGAQRTFAPSPVRSADNDRAGEGLSQ